jgi:hypothetical protein
MSLDELVSQLRAAYGPALRAVVLYGSTVAGEPIPRRSDSNVLVVVSELPLETLRAAAAVTKAWVGGGNPPPMTFTEREWRSSADVFPMEYADILERNRVLFGDDVFAGISVSPDHLRLQVEQEAMGAVLHLRQSVFGASADTRAQIDIMERSLSKLMILLRAVVRLHGDTPPTDYEALSRMVADRSGFDAEALVRVVRHVRGQTKIRAGEAAKALGEYLLAVEHLAHHLDRFARVS